MYDPTVHLGKIATIGCWVGAIGILTTAWVVGLAGDWRVGVLLGFTATVLLAAGVALSARGYAVRIVSLVRACSCEHRGAAVEDRDLRSIP